MEKPSLIGQMKSYPKQFWVANTIEIFERMAWYGWFTVMALYVTGSVETGGLGFSTETRGALQAIVPFFLYLMPVFTGALADRYGFKRTFIIAFLVMIVAYYLLGQFTSLPAFFLAFMFVALGAALFKPVVVGTVAKVTNDSNSATGFGIFYMMVNIGGFVGPIVAGVVRGWGWRYVFVACSFWALVNLVLVLTLYKEPLHRQRGPAHRVVPEGARQHGRGARERAFLHRHLRGARGADGGQPADLAFHLLPLQLVAALRGLRGGLADPELRLGHGASRRERAAGEGGRAQEEPAAEADVLQQLALRPVPAHHVRLLDELQPDLLHDARVHPRLRGDPSGDRGRGVDLRQERPERSDGRPGEPRCHDQSVRARGDRERRAGARRAGVPGRRAGRRRTGCPRRSSTRCPGACC